MSRRKQSKGGFIRNKPLTKGEQEYRVVSINKFTQAITLIGIFSSLTTAEHVAKSYKNNEVRIYIHGEENRVIAQV